MKPQHVLPLAIFLSMAVAFAAAFYLNLDPQQTPFAIKDRPMPAFDLPPALEGGEGLSSDDLRGGGPVILNFFAAWCAPCRAEHPVLMDLERRTGVPLYGIDYKDDREKVAAWLAADGNPFRRIGFDATGRTFIDWGLSGVPETFVIDARGHVVWRYQGALNDTVVEKILIPFLEEMKQ
jgi:cytochrome c biogenesis protein CcmG/thiol:disulfide interchange protein DsbE